MFKKTGLVLLSLITMLIAFYGLLMAHYQPYWKASQAIPGKMNYDSSLLARQVDDLRQTYGQNKKMPEQYALPILAALQHYPQLREVPILFEYQNGFLPIEARPTVYSILLAPKKDWVFRVIISPPSLEMAYSLHQMTFNQKIGVLGHELAHIAFYTKQSRWQMIGYGIFYFIPSFRKRFERDTDTRTIEHGLGWQLLSWTERLWSGKKPISGYARYYLSPQEIKDHMHQSALYQSPVN